MPEATHYIMPNTDDPSAGDLESRFRTEYNERRLRMDKLWRYYDGKMDKPTDHDNNAIKNPVMDNLVQVVADKTVNSMLGVDDHGVIEGVDFTVPEPDASALQQMRQRFAQVRRAVGNAMGLDEPDVQMPHQEHQAALDTLWDANNKNLFLADLMLNSAMGGHNFVKVIPDALVYRGARVPRFVLLDPRNCSVFWDASDHARVLWYRIEYGRVGARTREDVVRNVTEDGLDTGTWSVVTFREVSDGAQYQYRTDMAAAKWEMVGEPVEWGYEFPPIVDWPNIKMPNRYYGRDDFGLIPDLNDAYNLNLTLTHRITRHFASPRYFLSGVDDIKRQDGLDDIFYVENADARAMLLELQGDLSAIRGFGEALRQTAFNTGRELDVDRIARNLGELTNFGLRVLAHDPLGKRALKWLSADVGLRRLVSVGLYFGGYMDVGIDITPPDPLPMDPLQTAQAFAIDREHGLSQDTYLTRRGYNPDDEARKRQRERGERVEDTRVVDEARQVDALERIGAAANDRQPPTNGRPAQDG